MLIKRPNQFQHILKVLFSVIIISILTSLIVLIFFLVSVFVGFDIEPQAEFHITLNGQDIPDGKVRANLVTCYYPIVDEKHEKMIKELIPYIFDNDLDWSWSERSIWQPECERLMEKHGLNKKECFRGILGKNINMVRYIGHEKAECRNWCEKCSTPPTTCDNRYYTSREECYKKCEKTVKIPDHSKGCYWTKEELGSAYCKNSICRKVDYDLTDEFRLHIYLPSNDKDYLSTEVAAKNIASSFEVNLLPDGNMNLQETTSFVGSDIVRKTVAFIILSIIVLIIEFLTAWRYIRGSQFSKKVLKSILVINIISLPIVFWLVFPLLRKIMENFHYRSDYIFLILGWLFLFIFEGCLIYLINKKHISLKESFKLSALINLVSSIISILILLFFVIDLIFSW